MPKRLNRISELAGPVGLPAFESAALLSLGSINPLRRGRLLNFKRSRRAMPSQSNLPGRWNCSMIVLTKLRRGQPAAKFIQILPWTQRRTAGRVRSQSASAEQCEIKSEFFARLSGGCCDACRNCLPLRSEFITGWRGATGWQKSLMRSSSQRRDRYNPQRT